jgi:tRNA-specific 2-thiouridylase
VVAIDRENNRVVVGDDESLRTTMCEVQDVNWISLEAPSESLRASVKIRHKHVPAEATITAFNATQARIVFDVPQRAITSGQGAVFYDGARVLGGGWIR